VNRAALLVALLVATAGCRTAAIRLPLPADDPRPTALIRAWQERVAERRALRGTARLAVDGEQVHVRARQILVVERPSRLRVEVQGLLSQTVAVLVTDGPRYQLFRAEDRSFESGEVHPGLLWQVASLDLTPEEAIDVVLGAPRLDAALKPLRAFETGEGEIGIDLGDAAGNLRERRSFDAQGSLRRVERFAEGGEVAWSARFDGYAPVSGVPLAHAIRLEAGAPPIRAELALSGLELNPALPEGLFVLRPAATDAHPDGEGG
jgi:hypothetical protein